MFKNVIEIFVKVNENLHLRYQINKILHRNLYAMKFVKKHREAHTIKLNYYNRCLASQFNFEKSMKIRGTCRYQDLNPNIRFV